jgi:hypothetical protein
MPSIRKRSRFTRKSTRKSKSKSKRSPPKQKYNITLKKSTRSDKKYMVIIHLDKSKKTVHFGAKDYSDYTKHKDPERKERYITRHKKTENWNKSGINSAGFWSRWILWNKPTFKGSITDTEKRFNIKIRS